MSLYDPEAGVALVHIPKTAGWSAKAYMLTHLDHPVMPDAPELEELQAPCEIDPDMPIGHLALRDWERQVGTDPRDYELVVAVRRNPFAQTYSQFRYWRAQRARGHVVIQHVGAGTYGWGTVRTEREAFVSWLKDPRSQYHASYDYHDHRPPQPTGRTFADYGGFYAYWLHVGGEMPENVAVVDLPDLSDDLPALLDDHHTGKPGEVPRMNSGGHGEGWRDVLTAESEALIRERFAWSFEQGWWDDVEMPTREEAA